MEAPARLVVLISGTGSNLQAVLDACSAGTINARVSAVVSNRSDALGLHRADSAGVPALVAAPTAGQERSDYDLALADLVGGFEPDWVVLAGWMRLLSSAFLDRFPGRVINVHPALPGQLPGTRAIERAIDQASRGERQHTGVMVHLVPDEGVDDGPVLASEAVAIHPSDTLASLSQRIHEVEHRLLVTTLTSLCTPQETRR